MISIDLDGWQSEVINLVDIEKKASLGAWGHIIVVQDMFEGAVIIKFKTHIGLWIRNYCQSLIIALTNRLESWVTE